MHPLGLHASWADFGFKLITACKPALRGCVETATDVSVGCVWVCARSLKPKLDWPLVDFFMDFVMKFLMNGLGVWAMTMSRCAAQCSRPFGHHHWSFALKNAFSLNRVSAGVALLLVACLAGAQSTAQNQSRSDISAADFATVAAEQEAINTDMVAKAHARAGAAARAVLGAAADSMNPDEMDAQLADRVPGFAGWVHNDNGTSVMRMARGAGTGKVGAGAGVGQFDRSAGLAAMTRAMESPVETKPALFDSRQLLTFKDKVFLMASTKGVIATSIDRAANRVEVVYNVDLDANAIEELATKLVSAGVPRVALLLRPGELPKSVATSGVSVREQPIPLAAGAQFNFTTSAGSFVCSVGVPATRAGVRGFVTASHCSQQVYSVNAATTMTAPDGTFIGRETVDPAGFACSLPDTLGCREGDALFVSGAAPGVVDFGKVLITSRASLTVRGTIPVQGSLAYPTVGQTVYKTGRTSGTRSGRVARVCVNALVGNGAGQTYGALCSVELDSTTFIQGGDSGSSVWVYDGTGAVVTGIVSYGSSTTGGFSPWGGVTKELGALTIR
jgi:hypothetical protein